MRLTGAVFSTFFSVEIGTHVWNADGSRFMKFRILVSLFCASLFTTIVYAQTVNEELIAATRKSNVEAVKELLAKGADPNAKTPYGATPLFFACDRGSLEIVKILVERGADVNVKDTFYNSSAVGWAVSKNHVAIVKAGPKYELLATNPMGEVMMATPAISEGMIFVRTISHVYGIADASAPKSKAAK